MSSSVDHETWKPTRRIKEQGRLDALHHNGLPDSASAFPQSRKGPVTDAAHVRSALARFNQVIDERSTHRYSRILRQLPPERGKGKQYSTANSPWLSAGTKKCPSRACTAKYAAAARGYIRCCRCRTV